MANFLDFLSLQNIYTLLHKLAWQVIAQVGWYFYKSKVSENAVHKCNTGVIAISMQTRY